jgi:hypothetical protein
MCKELKFCGENPLQRVPEESSHPGSIGAQRSGESDNPLHTRIEPEPLSLNIGLNRKSAHKVYGFDGMDRTEKGVAVVEKSEPVLESIGEWGSLTSTSTNSG